MKQTTLWLVVSFFLLFGCNKTTTNHQDEIVNGLVATTDKLVYISSNGYAQVRFTIENTSDSTAWFFACGGRYITIINRLENDNWEDYGGWGWPCLAVYLSGIKPLAPDSTYFSFNQFDQTGDYRFSFLYNWENNIDTWSDTLYSNEFTIQ